MGRISKLVNVLRGRGKPVEERVSQPVPETCVPLVEERKTTAEEQVRVEHAHAAAFVSAMTPNEREFVFQCFDEMWVENNKRAVFLPADMPLYHAGVVRKSDEVEDWPMFLSPKPEGCDEYSKMVDDTREEVRSALVMETASPRKLADFTASKIDFSDPGRTPMGRLAQFTGGLADKTRAHLARAWCEERRLDGYERRSAGEVMIASPVHSLRVSETLDLDGFREKYLTPKKPRRARSDEER